MSQQNDTASILQLRIGNGGVESGKDPFGIGFERVFGIFHRWLLGAIGTGAGCLFDGVGGGAAVLAVGGGKLCGLRRRDYPWQAGVALQVRECQAQAAPAGVRQLAPQRSDYLRPVGGFAGARDDDHYTNGGRCVGRLPQGEEVVARGL